MKSYSIRLADLLKNEIITEVVIDQISSNVSFYGDLEVSGLQLDSRNIRPGDVFVAVQGEQVHGRDFIEVAINRGAGATFVEAENLLDIEKQFAVPVFALPQLNRRLSELAARFYQRPSEKMAIIGITGTNGKTTCSQLIAQGFSLLNSAHYKGAVIGTMGYGFADSGKIRLNDLQMTTADAITTQSVCAEFLQAGITNCAMEVSSHGLVQSRVAAVNIKTAIFTNLTQDHLDYHHTMAAYGQAKMQLFLMPSVELAILNDDDPFSSMIMSRIAPTVHVITYSLSATTSDFYLQNIVFSSQGASALLHTPEGVFPIKTHLVGRFNLSNLLAIVCAWYVHQVPLDDVVQLIPQLQAISGRMEIIPNSQNLYIVVDYAHTPDALAQSLMALAPYRSGHSRLWCVFGCGGDRDKGKRLQMAAVAEKYADCVVVTSDNPRAEPPHNIADDIIQGFTEQSQYHLIIDRSEAIQFAITQAEPGDVILLAGKGHEEYQIINTQRFFFSDQQQARQALAEREGVLSS